MMGTLSMLRPSLPQPRGELKPNKEQAEMIDCILGIKASRPLLLLGRRGRGKSATLGMAAAVLLQRTGGRILVTSPSKDASAQLFWAAERFLGSEKLRRTGTAAGGKLLYGKKGSLEFIAPERLERLQDLKHLKQAFLIVDEAAGFPVNFTAGLLQRAGRVLLATTLDGLYLRVFQEDSRPGTCKRELPRL